MTNQDEPQKPAVKMATIALLIFAITPFVFLLLQGQEKAAPIVPLTPSPVLEVRLALPFEVKDGSDTVGSITMMGGSEGFHVMSTERPGDSMLMSISFGGGTGGTRIATGDGSEVRFIGKFEWPTGTLHAADETRVCLKRANGAWYYVCGLGEFVTKEKTIRLGHERTVDSCLKMLAGEDPILREGAARELGRLAKESDHSRVVPPLRTMLADPAAALRRGAAEGLGLIANQDAVTALKQALSSEQDALTKEFIAEALSICGGLALSADPLAAKLPDEEAAALFLGESPDRKAYEEWKNQRLTMRMNPRKEEAIKVLTEKSAASELKTSNAAKVLLGKLTRTNSKTTPAETPKPAESQPAEPPKPTPTPTPPTPPPTPTPAPPAVTSPGVSREVRTEIRSNNGAPTNRTTTTFITSSGLRYEILNATEGPKPKATDTVTVRYHGTLPNGTIFDSSVQRGESATFPLAKLIAGWSEGVQLMSKGSKYRLTIPPNLAYGANGAGRIGPNQTVIFEIELIDFKSAP